MESYFNANRALWNAKVPHHLEAEFYEVAAFKAGKNVLREIELAALPDVKGKSILHLQCHFGQDTLCWARMGAVCTGVDFSHKAIRVARNLNKELGLDATFVESNIFDLKNNLDGQFDIVYTSYGVLAWLNDIDAWAEIVNHFLAKGGTFFIAEFHPTLYMLDWDKLTVSYDYFHKDEPDEEESQGTYANPTATIKMKEYFWSHSLSEIFQALMGQGLKIESFQEYPWSPYPCFPHVESIGESRWKIKGLPDSFPYVYSLKMTKP